MTKPDSKPGKPGGGINPGGGGAGGPKDPCRPSAYIYDPVTKSMVPPPGCPGAPSPDATPAPPPPPAMPDLIYDAPPSATMPDVKTGIIADQYAKLLDVPYRQAFMPGGPEDSIFAAANVMPPETKADPRPYSRTKQIPIRDLYKMQMRDATDAELLKLETGPDKPFMSKDDYEMMTYQLDYMEAKKPKKKPPVVSGGGGGGGGSGCIVLNHNATPPPGYTFTSLVHDSTTGAQGDLPKKRYCPTGGITPRPGGGGTYTGPGTKPPGPITGPVIPLPVVGGPPPGGTTPGGTPISGGVFTPSPGGGGGGTYTGPGVNLPGPVIPLPVVGGPPKTGGNLIPLSNELGFTIDNEGNKIYSDAEGNRVGMMDGGMMVIEDGVANDGIGGILKKYKEIRSEL